MIKLTSFQEFWEKEGYTLIISKKQKACRRHEGYSKTKFIASQSAECWLRSIVQGPSGGF